MRTTPLDRARRQLEVAEAQLAHAQRAVADADDQLDVALAAAGWQRRTFAVTSPGVKLYSRAGSDELVNRGDLLAALDQQAPSAA